MNPQPCINRSVFGAIIFLLSMILLAESFAADPTQNLLQNPNTRIIDCRVTNGSENNAEFIMDNNLDTVFSLKGQNAQALITIDLGQGAVIETLEIINGKPVPMFQLTSFAVGPDPQHFRELLGRGINLPVWRAGDTETVLLEPSVGQYVRLGFHCGVEGTIGEVRILGSPNRPERHLMCWAIGDLKRDYIEKLDYFQNDLHITDLWLDYVQTAFFQSNTNSGFSLWQESGLFDEFQKRGIRYWLGEHEFMGALVNSPEDLLDELRWKTTFRQIKQVYAQARDLGFRGLVFDCEDYDGVPPAVQEKYKTVADHVCVWTFVEHFGYNGMYYQRGLEIGKTIRSVWNPVIISLYEARMYVGVPGCQDGHYWFLKGLHDAELEIWIATEKTYGAGNREISDPEILDHLTFWFVNLPEFVPRVHEAFPFATRVLPGFHPWNTRTGKVNYLPKYLAEQVSVSENTVRGFWIYKEGNAKGGDPREVLDQDFLRKYGVTVQDYIDVLKRK